MISITNRPDFSISIRSSASNPPSNPHKKRIVDQMKSLHLLPLAEGGKEAHVLGRISKPCVIECSGSSQLENIIMPSNPLVEDANLSEPQLRDHQTLPPDVMSNRPLLFMYHLPFLHTKQKWIPCQAGRRGTGSLMVDSNSVDGAP